MTTWVVRHDANVARRVASFPEIGSEKPAPFVRVTVGSEHEELRSTVRRGASGDELRLSPGCFPATPDGTPCSYQPSTARAYRSFWLVRDPARQRALAGLVIAVAGVLLDTAVALGKALPLFVVGETGIAVTTAVGSVLTVVGLLVTFYGVYSSDN